MKWLLRKVCCALGHCLRCRTVSDDYAIWGECMDCGTRHGLVTRAELESYAEHELRIAKRKLVGHSRPKNRWLN